MKLVLFIGHHKVGSTSLQAFLAVNRRRLIDAGILYPMIEEPSLSSAYSSLSHEIQGRFLGRSPYERLPINRRQPHNALALRLMSEYRGRSGPLAYHGNVPSSADMLEIIRRQITRHQPEGLILCSESFSYFGGISTELVEWVRESFPADSVTIVCTLRRIDQYLCSWYGQRLKFGHRLSPLSKKGPNKFRRTIHFNYRKLIKAWIASFPGADLVLRNYAQVLHNGGSIADFIAHSGLVFPTGLVEYPNANPSIPYCFYELCRRINSTLPGAQAQGATQRIYNLSQNLEIPKNNEVELLGEKNRRWIYERFEGIHRYLSELIGESAFFPDQEDVLRCNPQPESQAARLALPVLANTLGSSPTDQNILRAVATLTEDQNW